jgi:Flp pilus assembly protein TadD/TolB-like protein
VTIVSRWVIAVAVCAAATSAGAQSSQAGRPAEPGNRYLVVPFENTNREGRLYWLSEGSAVVLTDDLTAVGAPAITRENRRRAFDRLHVPAVATLSYATVIRLGQLVGASYVVVGGFELENGRLTVRARAIRLDAGRMSQEVVEGGALEDIFAIYDRIARRLVPEGKADAERARQGYPPLAAFEQYIKGLLAEAPQTKLTYLAQAIALYPGYHRARLARWEVFTDQGEHKRALEVIREVPADHPLARRARFLATVSLISLGQYDEAFEGLQQLNRAKPDPAVLNNMGVVQLRRPATGSGVKAAYYFSEASKLDPEDSDLFFNLGYAYWLDKDVPAAVYWLREGVRRNPADDEAHYVLGVALQSTGSTAEAAREKELARQLSSTYAEWEAKQPASNPLPRKLERPKTEIDVRGSLRVESVLVASEQREQRELAAFHLDRGRRFFQQERDGEAIAELRRAVYLAPYQSEAHLLLGRVYLRTGRVREAVDALKISIWSEDTIPARLALAQAYILAKEDAAARAEISTVLKKDPANAGAKKLLEQLSKP